MLRLNKDKLYLRRAPTAAGRATIEEVDDLRDKTHKQLAQIKYTLAFIRQHPEITKGKDGHYYLGDRRIILDREDVNPILNKEYKAVPPATGYLRWYSLLKRDYVNLPRSAVESYLGNQEFRIRYRGLKKRSVTKSTIPQASGVRWTMDHAQLTREDKPVAIIIDNFSKFIYARVVPDQGSQATIKFLESWLEYLDKLGAPKPRAVGHDNGSGFVSEETQAWFKKQGIKSIAGSPYHPGSQGLAERAVRTVKQYAQSWLDAKRWKRVTPDMIEEISNYINLSYNRQLGTNKTPFEVLTGEKDEKLAEKLKDDALSRRNSTLYIKGALKPGDLVRLSIRLLGDSQTKSAIKSNQRKSYLESFPEGPTLRVKKVIGGRYKLSYLNGKPYDEQGTLLDRADLLKVNQPKSDNVYFKEPTVPKPKEPAAPKAPRVPKPKPQKPAPTGPNADLIGKEFEDEGQRFRIVKIGEEDGEKVAYYRRIKGGGSYWKGAKTQYSSLAEVLGWLKNSP